MPIRPKRPSSSDTYRPEVIVRSRVRSVPPSSTPEQTPDCEQAEDPSQAKRAHHRVDRNTDNWNEDGDYIIGKGRPPKAHQWKKGQSGNPGGPKPREKLSPHEAFDREVLAPFTTKVNGADVEMTAGTFAYQALRAAAAKGGVKAQLALLELYLTTLGRCVSEGGVPALDELNQKIIDGFLADFGFPAQPVYRQVDRSDDAGEAS